MPTEPCCEAVCPIRLAATTSNVRQISATNVCLLLAPILPSDAPNAQPKLFQDLNADLCWLLVPLRTVNIVSSSFKSLDLSQKPVGSIL